MKRPNKTGQIVVVGNDTSPLWVVKRIDLRSGSAEIVQLNTGNENPPSIMHPLDDLSVAMVSTVDLIGNRLAVINEKDGTKVYGRVVSVDLDEIELDIFKGKDGALSNVYATIVDRSGTEHYGRLFIDRPE